MQAVAVLEVTLLVELAVLVAVVLVQLVLVLMELLEQLILVAVAVQLVALRHQVQVVAV
jgi:hypothetical protein